MIQSKSQIKNLDIAFVEGAISTFQEAKRIKKIRKATKKLVLIGNCAINGNPSNLRNFFDEERTKEIQHIVEKFGHRKKVSSIKELVKADDSVPGCPMEEPKFIKIMEKYLKKFGVK